MRHLVYADHPIFLDQVFLEVSDEHELVQVNDFGDIINYPLELDGMVFLVLNATEGVDFATAKQKFPIQKVVLLSSSLREEDLKTHMRENNWIDLFYPVPVNFPEILEMHKVITSIHNRNELTFDVEEKSQQAPVIDLGLSALDATNMLDLSLEQNSTVIVSPNVTANVSANISQDVSQNISPLKHGQQLSGGTDSEISSKLPTSSQTENEIFANRDEQLYKTLAHNQLLRQKVQDLEKRSDQMEMESHYWKKKVEEIRAESEDIGWNSSLLEKNIQKERDEYRQKMGLLEEKIQYWEHKYHDLKIKMGELSSKQHMDGKNIRRREEELEERLSLLQSDTGAQIQNREKKLMELKRKLDLIEFDLQESVLREKEMKERIKDLEHRLEMSVSTLRGLFQELDMTNKPRALKKVD
ncbi:MAG: hypothetical protein QE271_05775 [Bacteriovoracaceae bacterium]|nr:hypothetical protein [Bacteriovoracaceae bacterium]